MRPLKDLPELVEPLRTPLRWWYTAEPVNAKDPEGSLWRVRWLSDEPGDKGSILVTGLCQQLALVWAAAANLYQRGSFDEVFEQPCSNMPVQRVGKLMLAMRR